MRVPFVLFVIFAGGTAALSAVPGLHDLALIAGLGAVASLVLLVVLVPRAPKPMGPDPRRIWVDGSNVMHWQDNTPSEVSLVAVVQHVELLGYRPFVIFDANAGYLLQGAYLPGAVLAQLLGLPARQVIVAPKGTPADAIILARGRKTGLPIVSNDRYRDWEVQHPEIRAPGRLVRGGWRNGRPWVDMAAFAEPRKAA